MAAEVGRDGREVIRTDKHKGRGAKPDAEEEADADERYKGKGAMFDSLDDEPGAGPQRCEFNAGWMRARISMKWACVLLV